MACNNSESSKELNTDSIKENVGDTSVKKEDIDEKKELVEQPIKPLLIQANEKIVFSFKTNRGKIVNILLDKNEKYIVYRFGTKEKVELQFPEKLENSSFVQFTYSYYFRGGGAMNMGLDLNYLSFKGDSHQFVIFDEWSAGESGDDEGNKSVGIKIIDLTTKKEIIIEGLSSTVKGSLVDFRDNGLVKVEEGEM